MNGDNIHRISVVLAVAIHVVVFAATMWDFYLSYVYGPRATVSAVITSWSREWPIVPLLVGILIGHLFWGQVNPNE